MSARFFKWRMMVWNTCDPGAHALQGSTGAPQPAASVPAFPRLAPRLTSLPAQPSARPHRFYYYVLWYIRIEWDVEKSTDIVSQKFFFFLNFSLSSVNKWYKKEWRFAAFKGQFWRIEKYYQQFSVYHAEHICWAYKVLTPKYNRRKKIPKFSLWYYFKAKDSNLHHSPCPRFLFYVTNWLNSRKNWGKMIKELVVRLQILHHCPQNKRTVINMRLLKMCSHQRFCQYDHLQGWWYSPFQHLLRQQPPWPQQRHPQVQFLLFHQPSLLLQVRHCFWFTKCKMWQDTRV